MQEVLKKRRVAEFKLSELDKFKVQAFYWATQFKVVCYLDSNKYPGRQEDSKEALLAVGMESELLLQLNDQQPAFSSLQDYYEEEKDWLFGFLTYDLKNDVEELNSRNFDGLDFPKLHFFQPRYVLSIKEKTVEIFSNNIAPSDIFNQIVNTSIPKNTYSLFNQKPQLQSRVSKKEYLKTIRSIRKHLSLGDIYEMNFCQEFYAENCVVNVPTLFQKLNKLSKAPFSAYYRLRDYHLISASPERFLKKIGSKLISHPIKGTAKRGKTIAEDQKLKKELMQSQKDRSENVMIVDLVRNDLARSCVAGSVKVEELFKIYPFEQVYQMISTISGELRPDTHFVEAIKNAFPMGSMTGAPKVRSMQLIEHYEQSMRGLYSGAVGYITPEGDFDFNVVIRSMLYNADRKYLSFQVGGAIVYDSTPEKEYEECLLKAKGIMETLGITK